MKRSVKWIKTDDNQFVEKVSPSVYRVIELEKVEIQNTEDLYSLKDSTVDVEREINEHPDYVKHILRSFGYGSLKELVESSKGDAEIAYQLLAEMIVESEQDYEVFKGEAGVLSLKRILESLQLTFNDFEIQESCN